jgi:hypothetical protein
MSGMLTCALSETITQVRLITGPVRLYVPTPTMCVVDGQPYACPAGVHRTEVARSPLYRIFMS